jgi:outer membrane protein assembly factor BamB
MRRANGIKTIAGLAGILALSLPGSEGLTAEQPQWGEAWGRNMTSAETNLAESFDPRTGRNIKWSVALGTESHSTPVVAGGRVFIGTNNGDPRDPKHQGDRGVLMCFEEQTGRLLWQLVVPKREEDPYFDWPKSGISSPVTVQGERVYVVNNRGEVVCLDIHGLANGNDGPFREEGAHMTPPGTNAPPEPLPPGPLDADILWLFDLTTGAGIWSHDAAHSSILIDGRYLYLNTATGVDNTHKRIRLPDAPSLVVLDKRTGKLVARENEQNASRIFHCTWSSPSLGEVAGRPLVFFAGGDGIVYAYEALSPGGRDPSRLSGLQGENGSAFQSLSVSAGGISTLKKIWQFDFDPAGPKENVHRYNGNRRDSPSNIYGMPVFHGNRIYVAGGGDLFWGKNEAWLKCIDATKTGDVTTNGLIWSYALNRHVLSTPAVHEGLVFIADCGRVFHCLDAQTGRAIWTHDIKGEVWASPLVADGKVYLGTRSGDFYVFAASREKKVVSALTLGSPISATATAANQVLYVATMSRLLAVQAGAHRR